MASSPPNLVRRWPLAAALVVAFVALSPSLSTGWVGDDAMNSTLPGYWQILGVDPASDTLTQIQAWWATGRFNPLMHVWKNAWFWYVRDLAVHKSLILALMMLDLWLLYRLSRVLGLSRESAALGALLAAVLVQFREYHDPVLAFNGMMQFVAALVLGSLLALFRYRETGRTRWLAVSLGLQVAGCLTYECCLALCLAHAALLPWRRALPFVAAAGLVLAVNMTLRLTGETPPESPYRMVLRGSLVWKTFTRQCVAALPFSYGGFDPYRNFAASGGVVRECLGHVWIGLAVMPLATALAWRMSYRGSLGFPVLLGAGLFLLPAVPIAVCHRYQWELAPGLGHLPVFLQMIGVALLLLSGAISISRLSPERARPYVAVGVGLMFAVIAIGHRTTNAVVVASLLPDLQLRSGLEAALRSGLLNPVPEGGDLLTEFHPWETGLHGSAFYLQHAGKRLNIHHPGDPGEATAHWRIVRPQDGGRFRLERRD